MTAKFNSFGIEFMYPENWELSQDDDTRFPRTVSVHSPNGSFWSISIYPVSEEPAAKVDDFVEALRNEYDEIEIEVVESDESLPGVSTDVSLDLNFYCLDLLITIAVFGFRFDDFTMVLHYQGESRDFDANKPVFSAISQSLLS